MIHYFYGTLQVGIGQTLCSFEHVSCYNKDWIGLELLFASKVLHALKFRKFKIVPGSNPPPIHDLANEQSKSN